MSNVIQFLESLGRNPAMTRMSTADYAASVAMLDVDHPQQEALIARDVSALSTLLEGRTKMFFMVATPNDEPDQDDGYVPDNEEPVEPDDAK